MDYSPGWNTQRSENYEMSALPPSRVPAAHPGSPQPMGSIEDKLRLAASRGQLDICEELIQAGATYGPDKDGRTALQYAALNGYVDVCKLLLQHNQDKDAQDALGYTALHRAASKGQVEVIEALAEGGCAVNLQDKNGNTALHEAAWNGYSKTVEMMVKHEVDTFVSNKGGFTALHLASQNGHNESSRVLLYAGCNADLKNNYGDTALHTAARYGHAGVTRILLSARCRINEQNKNGDTSLHIASALKRRKIAKLLVEAGMDPQITNKQGETAMDVAKRKEHPEIIIIIQSFSRPKTPKSPRPPSRPNVTFKDEIEVDGPVVVPHEEQPITKEKPEKERRFFFFKKKKKDKDKDKEKTPPSKAPPSQQGHQCVPGEPWRPVQGFFSQYVPKTGVQYYRDLAGNIKQGPVGYSPACQCGPSFKNLEQRIDTTRENMVDHVNASHQLLKGQIDHLDKRTAQQVYSIDRLTKERLENEHNLCHNRISERLRHERQGTHQMFTEYNEQIQTWLDTKLASYGHCLSHHHDDSALPSQKFFTDFHENENGRLFRSRSDETLSVSDYSGKHRKKDFYESRQEAMQLIRAWQLPSYRQSQKRRERPVNNNYSTNNYNSNVTVTKAEVHGRMDRVADGASPKYEGSPSRQMMAQHATSKHSPIDVSAIKRDAGNQGAIPKRLPHSHSWQHSGPQGNRSRSTSPQVLPRSHSREGSPLDARPGLRPIIRSHTETSNLRNSTSTPMQNLYERGPPNVRSKPGAPEVPPKPPKPGTGQITNSGLYNRQGSTSQPGQQILHHPTQYGHGQSHSNQAVNHQYNGSAYPPASSASNVRQSYMSVEESPPTVFKPRTRSSDSMDDGGFAQRVTRSRSLDRTLDEVDRPRSVSGNFQNGQHRQSGNFQGSHQNIPYRPPSAGPTGQNAQPVGRLGPSPSNVNFDRAARNTSYAYRESPYASAREMQRIANSVHASSPSPKPAFTAYERKDPNRDSGRESNYADINQFSKDVSPHRSMYDIHGDKGSYSNYESMAVRNPMSKSENNLTKDYQVDPKNRPNNPPPYGYRYGDTGAKSSNQGNSATNNTITNYNMNGNHVNSPSNKVSMRTGSVTPVSGQYGSSKISDNLVNSHGNHVNEDTFNGNTPECLHHDGPYQRTSVYNPVYNQSKEDSTCSSNQDSGYSSKAKLSYLGQSPDGLPSNSGTPSSSFSMDRSLSTGTPSQTNSPFSPHSQTNSPFTPHRESDSPYPPHRQNSSPFTPVSNSPFSPHKESTPAFNFTSPNYEHIQPAQQPESIKNHVNGWYQKKLLEAAEKLRKSEQYSGAHNFSTAPINYDPVNGSDV